MAYKMKGFGGFKASPAKQKVSKDASQTRNLYKGPLTKEDTKKLKDGESHNEVFNDKDEAAWFVEQDGNELSGNEKKKSRKKSDAMFNEAYIVRDRGVGKKK